MRRIDAREPFARTLVVLGNITVAIGLLIPASADAFCGFYVSGSKDDLYNNATRVSLMRNDNTTVLSMQNNYEGPPKDFAMVVPVPVVLEKKQVKTLENAVFDRLDKYTAPRLVEYWERDPCWRPRRYSKHVELERASKPAPRGAAASRSEKKEVVKVEAKFKVGEYDIVVLSSEESTALEDWLRNHNYNIPKGSAKYLRPYIQKGQYFFVAKVNMDKVKYDDGEAVLSPLRFHYDTQQFMLPVRLGLINSKGSQHLIVYTLSPKHRFKVANYPNVTIPTNIRLDESVKSNFAGFYSELFRRVMEENPKSVVTEYSWRAGKCDPCPTRPLQKKDLMSLGADVVAPVKVYYEKMRTLDPFGGRHPGGPVKQRREVRVVRPGDWVVTRLHTRYSKETLGKDLVFEKAKPIRGGRGMPKGDDGIMPDGDAKKSSRNNFQGRYVILHPWKGEATCENPRHGIWGGPNRRGGGGGGNASSAGDIGFSSREPQPLSESVKDEKVEGLKKPTEKYDATVDEESGGGDASESTGGVRIQ